MDFINVIKDDGTKEKMEVVSIFEKSDSDYHYIIYKDLENHFYVGKYLGDDLVDLITELTDDEYVYVNSVLNTIVGE